MISRQITVTLRPYELRPFCTLDRAWFHRGETSANLSVQLLKQLINQRCTATWGHPPRCRLVILGLNQLRGRLCGSTHRPNACTQRILLKSNNLLHPQHHGCYSSINVVIRGAVMRFKYVQCCAVRHFGFDRKWNFTIFRLPRTHDAPVYQIST